MPARAVTDLPLRAGEELPNGCTCLAIRLLGRQKKGWAGDVYAVVALTRLGGDPLAVWFYIPPCDTYPDGLTYDGFYTDDLERAVWEWRQRRAP